MRTWSAPHPYFREIVCRKPRIYRAEDCMRGLCTCAKPTACSAGTGAPACRTRASGGYFPAGHRRGRIVSVYVRPHPETRGDAFHRSEIEAAEGCALKAEAQAVSPTKVYGWTGLEHPISDRSLVAQRLRRAAVSRCGAACEQRGETEDVWVRRVGLRTMTCASIRTCGVKALAHEVNGVRVLAWARITSEDNRWAG